MGAEHIAKWEMESSERLSVWHQQSVEEQVKWHVRSHSQKYDQEGVESSKHTHDVLGGVEVEAKLFAANVNVHTTGSVDEDSRARLVAALQFVDDGSDLVSIIPHQGCTVARPGLIVRTGAGVVEVEDTGWHFDIAEVVAVGQVLHLIVSESYGTITRDRPGSVRII
jgi:hypothetical protein